MQKVIVHTDDLPHWAVRQEKLPQPYLGFLRDAVYPSSDSKGGISLEDQMLRQHWDAMLTGNSKARDWLLREVIKRNKAVLAAAPERPQVFIEGTHNFQALRPVLEILTCVELSGPEAGIPTPPNVSFSPMFLEALRKHCPEKRLAPVLAWHDAGGQQKPRIRHRDRFD